MCLAVPGQIVELTDAKPPFTAALVKFGGIYREVSVACVPEACVGDYVMVHAGVAICQVDAVEAARVLETLRELDLDDSELETADDTEQDNLGP